MQSFTNVSVILPAINETYSFQKTADVILETCAHSDLAELFIVLCNRTTPDCVRVAERIRDAATDVPVTIYYQQKPFIGAAIQEAIERVSGSHMVMMSTDLETPPELIARFIELAKKTPDTIITASRSGRGRSEPTARGRRTVSTFCPRRAVMSSRVPELPTTWS